MKRAFVGLVILLAFFAFTGALFWAIMAGGGDTSAFAARRVVAQVQPTETPHLVSTAIIGWFSDGSFALLVDTATPAPSTTPTATASPTASATSTATPTSTSTLPPDDTATPTQETTPPPPTFTFTPQPSKLCSLRSGHPAGLPINIRSGPGTSFSIIGNWPVGTESVFDAFQLDATYLWAHHQSGGWNVVALVNPWVWWATGTADSEACREVDGWPGTDPPAPIAFEATHGGHAISSTGANALLEHCEKQTAVKLFEHVMHYAAAFRACNPDIFIVCRFWTDDIARETNYNAEATYAKIGAGFPSDCDAAEPENEKLPRSPDEWRAWVQWAIDFSTLMAERRNMQVLVLGMGPGWPAFDDLHYILPYLRWVNDHPLPDGRYHGVSSHASPYAPFTRADMPWLNDPYIAGRVYLMRDWLYATTTDNFDLYEWHGVWFISELGLSDGYSGTWSAPYSCNEVKLAYWETQNHYSDMGFPDGFSWWNFGPPWTDDSACAGALWG